VPSYSFLIKDSPNGFRLSTHLLTFLLSVQVSVAKASSFSFLVLFPAWIWPAMFYGSCRSPLSAICSPLSFSLRDPALTCPSCPAGIFLRPLCFLSQSKQIFYWGFWHSFFNIFQDACWVLAPLGCSFWCFSFLIFAFLRLNIHMLNVFGPTTQLILTVLWSLLQSISLTNNFWIRSFAPLMTKSRKVTLLVGARTSCSKNHPFTAIKIWSLHLLTLSTITPHNRSATPPQEGEWPAKDVT